MVRYSRLAKKVWFKFKFWDSTWSHMGLLHIPKCKQKFPFFADLQIMTSLVNVESALACITDPEERTKLERLLQSGPVEIIEGNMNLHNGLKWFLKEHLYFSQISLVFILYSLRSGNLNRSLLKTNEKFP